jgi:hypothetical protein
MKNIIILLICLSLFFGCVAIPSLNDSKDLEEFKAIQLNYGVENGFLANQQSLNSYLNELSEFRGKIMFGETAQIIDAEIATTKVFYYLVLALTESNSFDFYNINCNNIRVKNSIAYSNLVIKNASEAEQIISSLSEDSRKYLRENQLESIKEFKQNAEQIKISINEVC